MTEETIVDKVEETVEEEVVEVVEPSPTETTAREQGWVSKEEWVASGRGEDEWRPAKEFVERGEIFKSLHSVKRELKQERAAREALQKHHQFVFEKAHAQALQDLKLQKRQAIRAEDFESLEVIEDEIDKLQETHVKERAQMQAQVSQPANIPEFDSWVERNGWYAQDQDLRDFADATGIVFANRNPNTPPATVLKHVETEVRKKFPEKFGVKRAAPNAVASVDRTGAKPRKESYELNETERTIMNDLVKMGVMTEAQYIADLKKVNKR